MTGMVIRARVSSRGPILTPPLSGYRIRFLVGVGARVSRLASTFRSEGGPKKFFVAIDEFVCPDWSGPPGGEEFLQ